MAEPTGTSITLLKLGVSLLQRTAPTGIAYIKSWLKGKTIIVVGQARAGKTTFIDYFEHGLFNDEAETGKTKEITPSARFNVKLGRDLTLEMNIKTVLDIPGQIGATAHANETFNNNPDAVIIILDLTSPLNGKDSDRASAAWLEEFCKHLESKWRAKKRKNNRVKTIILILNKLDKFKGNMDRYRKTYRKILENELREAKGQIIEDILALPTISVTNEKGTKYLDTVIENLAKSLAK